MEKDRETKIIRKLFLSLLPTQAIAYGLPSINDLINSLIVGKTMGAETVAAIGFAGPYTMFITGISVLISTGSQLLCARSIGSGDKKNVQSIYTTTVTVCAVFGIVITLLTQLFSGTVARLFGTSSECMVMTAEYIRGLGLGTVFTVMFACLIPFLQLDNKGRVSTAAVIVQLFVNITGNVLNIFLIKQGTFGVGLATAAANILAAVIGLAALQAKSNLFRFDVRLFDGKTIGPMLRSGAPSGIGSGCEVIREIVMNSLFYLAGGTLAMSAKTICANLSEAAGCIVDGGYAGSCRLIAGGLVGERDSSSLRDLPKVMAKSAGPMIVGVYAVLFLLAGPISRTIVSDPAEVAYFVSIIRLYLLWFVTGIIKNPPIAIYQAMDRTRISTFLMVLNMLVFPIAVGYALTMGPGLPALAIWPAAAEVLLFVVMAVLFTVQAHRLPRSVMELCYIPSSISAPRENRYKAVVSTLQDACRVSQEIMEFCRNRGMDKKRAFYCGLSVEEVLTDIIRNRFKGKDNTIDVRVIYEDGGVSMMIRDNCEEFDVLKWIKLCTPEEKERSLGIKTVIKLAREVNYICTLGLNVLTIKI